MLHIYETEMKPNIKESKAAAAEEGKWVHLQQLVLAGLGRVRDNVDHESSFVVDEATDDEGGKSDDGDEVVMVVVVLVVWVVVVVAMMIILTTAMTFDGACS